MLSFAPACPPDNFSIPIYQLMTFQNFSTGKGRQAQEPPLNTAPVAMDTVTVT